MPSKTFLNLPEEKRQKLLKAATDEFSNTSFFDASINKIINNANISRGSFYMYFEGKEELFEYILDSYSSILIEIVKKELINSNGDLRESFINLYDELLIRISKIKYKIFFRNVFLFLNLKREKIENKGKILFEEVKSYISTYNIKDVDLNFVFLVLMHNLFFCIADALCTGKKEETKDVYLKKLDMICYGFYK